MNHVVLLGDSIFDNARDVPGGPSVIEHLRRILPAGWQATLLAQAGGGKIARAISRVVTGFDFRAEGSVVFA